MPPEIADAGATVSVSALDVAMAEIATLNEALQTRTTIGEAVGMLMNQRTISADAAFASLVEISSRTNTKIRDIAARMVAEANTRALCAGTEGGTPPRVATTDPEVA